jgi:hypothetical protein
MVIVILFIPNKHQSYKLVQHYTTAYLCRKPTFICHASESCIIRGSVSIMKKGIT